MTAPFKPSTYTNIPDVWNNAWAEGGPWLAINMFNPVYSMLENGASLGDAYRSRCWSAVGTYGLNTLTDAVGLAAVGAAAGGRLGGAGQTSRATAGDAGVVVGRRGSPMTVPRGSNASSTIGGRPYTGHALDEMQSEGFTPSFVEDVVMNGVPTAQSGGRIAHYSPGENVTVITEGGTVITVTSGRVSPR